MYRCVYTIGSQLFVLRYDELRVGLCFERKLYPVLHQSCLDCDTKHRVVYVNPPTSYTDANLNPR